MTRAARTGRGAIAAAAATLVAAISHAAAGGAITPLAVGATAVLALPICVALAGRLGSLWRLALAVGASQFLYHWSFWELGLSAGRPSGDAPAAPHHAAHLTTVFAPELVASGAAEAWMWASHAAAAILTVVLLRHGEQAAAVLGRVVFQVLLRPTAAAPVAPPSRTAVRVQTVRAALRDRLTVLSAISHRGPPAALASTF
ncbi:hypothetical protein LEUCIP111803_00210 [Leucobacter soli]|uniref:Integral membrane protein n=3 Tax=Leucobacter soli TaxID=2812850 RepID=A0A916JS31_9MICO|nr:hypothetical protein LEUCIP111803_00210 [Leucobacter soli]